jgi:hypothetical protein
MGLREGVEAERIDRGGMANRCVQALPGASLVNAMPNNPNVLPGR